MKFVVEISAQARKQLKRMPKAEKKKLLDKIDSLSDNPRPFGYKNSLISPNIFECGSATTASSIQFKINNFWL